MFNVQCSMYNVQCSMGEVVGQGSENEQQVGAALPDFAKDIAGHEQQHHHDDIVNAEAEGLVVHVVVHAIQLVLGIASAASSSLVFKINHLSMRAHRKHQHAE